MKMATKRQWWYPLMFLMCWVSGPAQAAGLLAPKDGNLPALEIRAHAVDVVIEDGYAITRVEQVFRNPHDRDLEAIYSFPVPKHGSVGEFTMWIDGKPVTGEVLEKKQAREVYEQEKQAGREAGLTEKDEYRTFDIHVSPVRAGQETRIRLVYFQPAHIDTGIGRYVYPLEEGGVDEQKLAFWTANENVTEQFSFNLRLKSAYPIDAVRVPNQNAVVQQAGGGEWLVNLNAGAPTINQPEDGSPVGNANFNPRPNAAAYTLDKDLVVYWRHQAGLPGSVDLIAYKPDPAKRGSFMLVVTPGDDLKPLQLKGRDWVFVLDISGSMRGKYATLADGVQQAFKQLTPNDRFRVITFNNSAQELTSGFVNANSENVARYSRAVAETQPGGGTNLYQGLRSGLDSLDADRTTAIVLVTDGVANVGETAQRKFIDLVGKKDVRLFTAIMGNSANVPMLEALTKASGGFAVSVSNSDDIVGQLLAATGKVGHEALHGVKIEIDGVKTADLTPREIGSLYRGQQLVVFGHYWGEGEARVKVRGKISGRPKTYTTRFDFPAVATDNPEIERLWAYAGIEDLIAEINDFGENADLKNAVVQLGVEYGLVTDYTSMVVVREEMFERLGIPHSNRQRLAVEQAAQQTRAGRPAVNRRVDNQQPMYKSSRPSFSRGGGAVDPWTLLVMAALAWVAWRRRPQPDRA